LVNIGKYVYTQLLWKLGTICTICRLLLTPSNCLHSVIRVQYVAAIILADIIVIINCYRHYYCHYYYYYYHHYICCRCYNCSHEEQNDSLRILSPRTWHRPRLNSSLSWHASYDYPMGSHSRADRRESIVITLLIVLSTQFQQWSWGIVAAQLTIRNACVYVYVYTWLCACTCLNTCRLDRNFLRSCVLDLRGEDYCCWSRESTRGMIRLVVRPRLILVGRYCHRY